MKGELFLFLIRGVLGNHTPALVQNEPGLQNGPRKTEALSQAAPPETRNRPWEVFPGPLPRWILRFSLDRLHATSLSPGSLQRGMWADRERRLWVEKPFSCPGTRDSTRLVTRWLPGAGHAPHAWVLTSSALPRSETQRQSRTV